MIFLSWATAGAAAEVTARPISRYAATLLMALSSPGLHVHVLDDIAEIAGGVPQRLRTLGFADPVERADQETVVARAWRHPGRRPLSERVSAKIGSELNAAPRRPAIARQLHFGDPVAAVEGDTLDGDGLPHRHAHAVSRHGDEG